MDDHEPFRTFVSSKIHSSDFRTGGVGVAHVGLHHLQRLVVLDQVHRKAVPEVFRGDGAQRERYPVTRCAGHGGPAPVARGFIVRYVNSAFLRE